MMLLVADDVTVADCISITVGIVIVIIVDVVAVVVVVVVVVVVIVIPKILKYTVKFGFTSIQRKL